MWLHSRAVRRLLLIAMMCLLPLQLSWAAVARICLHESGGAAQHLGHHEHEHDAAKGDAAVDGLGIDADCGPCHGYGPAALMIAPKLLHTESPQQHTDRYRSTVPDPEPDRLLRPPLTDLA